MQHKSCKAEFKALDEEKGTFEAIVSVFGNVDLIGDRVVKGAFTKSLESWNKSGDPIPVIWSHMWANPAAHIGKTISAEETDDGLLVKGQLDLDHPFAAKVYKLLKERRVKEFSFAYDVPEGGEQKNKADGANDLLELEIIEVGPTLKGMNPATQLVAAKALDESLGAKAGRVLSAKNESELKAGLSDLQSGIEKISNVLKQVQTKAPDEGKAKTEEPAKAKAEEPTPSVLLALAELRELEIEAAAS